MLVPAASAIASTPHVTRPATRRVMIVNVPAGPRSKPGRSAPTTTSSIAPVPKVIFAWPGSMHA